jgi:hypothetical protein
MLLVLIVHGSGGIAWTAASAEPRAPASATVPPVQPGSPANLPLTAPLPPAAADMYEAILSAVHSGAIEHLKEAYDLGELHADLGLEPGANPVVYWKSRSADGEGREILAIIADLFAVGPAMVRRGKDPENNAVYVWPYLAELPLDKLTPAQEVDLLRLMSVAEAKAMRAQKTYTGWRLTIGADGLWHAFRKGP